MYESAKIDDASEWDNFIKIALPLSKPIIAVIALYYAVDRWNEYYNALIYISNEMIRRISQVVQKQEKEKDNKNKEFFDSILQYIEENACDNQLSQKSVAEHFDISERQVSRLFLDFLHLNYKEYVIQIRVDRAQKLLRDGVSVADTALQVGYAHIPHFIKIFKERVGVTPGKYKDRLLADEPFEQ